MFALQVFFPEKDLRIPLTISFLNAFAAENMVNRFQKNHHLSYPLSALHRIVVWAQ